MLPGNVALHDASCYNEQIQRSLSSEIYNFNNLFCFTKGKIGFAKLHNNQSFCDDG